MDHPRIEVNPKVMFGKPVIRGTRITVEQVLRKLAKGCSVAAVQAAHPHLAEADVYAAIAFAADMLSMEEIRLSGHPDVA